MKELSKIQNEILSKLLRSKGLRYSEAKVQNIDNDLYNYHLQFLVSKKFVEKKDGKYYLTDKGKQYVQKMDVLGRVKKYFKVSVLPYVVRTFKGKRQILLQRRLRHPYFGDIGTVSGKVHVDEKLEEAARRKLKQETGLETDFRLIGVIRKIRRDKEGKVIEDTLYHVCYGEDPEGKLVNINKFGENFWADFTTAINYQRKNITAGKETEKVLKRISKKNIDLFYFHEDIDLKHY